MQIPFSIHWICQWMTFHFIHRNLSIIHNNTIRFPDKFNRHTYVRIIAPTHKTLFAHKQNRRQSHEANQTHSLFSPKIDLRRFGVKYQQRIYIYIRDSRHRCENSIWMMLPYYSRCMVATNKYDSHLWFPFCATKWKGHISRMRDIFYAMHQYQIVPRILWFFVVNFCLVFQ